MSSRDPLASLPNSDPRTISRPCTACNLSEPRVPVSRILDGVALAFRFQCSAYAEEINQPPRSCGGADGHGAFNPLDPEQMHARLDLFGQLYAAGGIWNIFTDKTTRKSCISQ